MKNSNFFFDSNFNQTEQLPRKFTVKFDPVKASVKLRTRVSVDGVQVGDLLDDNSKENDGYRFHDVFHYTFAAILGWSPCIRSMMKRKRKSVLHIDEIEDGARATITEEAISLLVFNKAKQNQFFTKKEKISGQLLTIIKEMTTPFEVNVRSKKDWREAIFIGYSLFCNLLANDGGTIHFDMVNRTALYEKKACD